MKEAAIQIEKQVHQPSLLLVDDEANVLSSLRRLFRPLGYKILTAEGGVQGLEVLGREQVDLVISDMRMPGMTGAEFLENVAQRWPGTVRMLLTGYTELDSAVDAINKGQIYRYLTKPWDDDDIKLAVKQVLERKYLEDEKLRLEELTRKQNEELQDLNSNLEKKVEVRTKELHRTVHLLKQKNEELEESYFSAIPVFSSLVELYENTNRGHSKRVAEHARELAMAIGLEDREVRNVYFAGLLHDIGKIGFSDQISSKTYSALTPDERVEFEKHTYMGQAALMALKPLEQTAAHIRSHHERFDGKGYPDGLAGESIAIGARVLAVANDYDSLCAGMLLEESFSENEARDFLRSHRGERYDPKIVDAFVELLKTQDERVGRVPEKKVTAKDLREGMKLSKDLVNSQGLLLLSQGQRLSEALIEKLRSLEMQGEKCFVIHVNQEQSDGGK